MTLTNIISAIGNNSSIYPLILRDCGVEIPSKVYLTYKENRDDKDVAFLATRERIIDEYATSLVWLGGIPLVEKLIDKFIIKKNGLNPLVNLKLFQENDFQGMEYNIKRFNRMLKEGNLTETMKRELTSALEDMQKVKKNRGLYEKLLSVKFLSATIIPIALMGFVIPKAVFALTAKTKAEKRSKMQKQDQAFGFDNTQKRMQLPTGDVFNPMKLQSSKGTSFTGNFSSTVANFTTYQKMATIDGGYAVGRVATSRKKNEAVDIGFKMLGMLFLNFVAPKYIAKILDSAIGKMLNLDVKLDPLMLEDKEFLKLISSKQLAANLPTTDSGKDILRYIDENPKSLFTKYAVKFEKVKMLKSGIRDPRVFVDTDDLAKFKKSIEEFGNKALEVSGGKSDIESIAKQVNKFAKKAKFVKSANIIANVIISSTLLAYCLPKAQYAFREWYTGSKLEPGIAE